MTGHALSQSARAEETDFIFYFKFFKGLLLPYIEFRMDKTMYSNYSNDRLFMAPHLIRARSAYKDIRIR